MKRRLFVRNISMGGLALSLPVDALLVSCNSPAKNSGVFKEMVGDLLQEWCDGMLKNQIVAPDQPKIHGALDCPACDHIHGRCMDAVYPFLYMADQSGDEKYFKAATMVMEWAENNVSQEDGSWTVIPDPKSWRGITVFGAIALAEALHYHGHVLNEALYSQWKERLARAAEYIYQKFDLTFTNINYGATAIYGLYIFGKILNNKTYLERSHELAKGIPDFFSDTDYFLFGEGKPSRKISNKGLYAIDLGYNVEESLSNLVLYAVETQNEELKSLLVRSLKTHLEFMLPDGAWDNSWGTRQYKWTYWGSRTCDGSQLTYAYLSDKDPAFSKAVVRNTQLLKGCTNNGLLHGGPHYVQHGILPCIHHTFEHAKPLATLLNNWEKLQFPGDGDQLPREQEYGTKYFRDIDTVLLAGGPWRGTVTAYDAIYSKGEYRQATGGSLSVLHHKRVGILLTASMAKYKLAEKNNQQPNPGIDFALTPRIETFIDTEWYTNLFDLSARIKTNTPGETSGCFAEVVLRNEAGEKVTSTASDFVLQYVSQSDTFVIIAEPRQAVIIPTALVLPIIAGNNEPVRHISENKILIEKNEGNVIIESDVPLQLKLSERERVFNMVPGLEAAPIIVAFPEDTRKKIKVTVFAQS